MGSSPLGLDGVLDRRLVDASGREHRVLVAGPSAPPPDSGYPLVVLLDAQHGFGTIVEGIRLRARRPDATGVGPAIVVGLNPIVENADRHARRVFDYTPWPGPDADPHAVDLASGGAAAFLRFLEGQVLPPVEAQYPIDASHRVLIGHSLAGLFTLWALSVGAPFTAYVSVSPSLWWNATALRDVLTRRVANDADIRRVMLTVGEYEQRRAPWQPAAGITDDALRRRIDRRMVEHAFETASIVTAAGHVVDYHVFEGEDHASVLALTLARALRCTLPPACRMAATPWSPIGDRTLVSRSSEGS